MSEKVKEFLTENLPHIEHIQARDALKLFSIRQSHAYLIAQELISNFSFLYSDGDKSCLAITTDSPKIESTVYEQLAHYADSFLGFAFWIAQNGRIFVHNVTDPTTLQKEDGYYNVQNNVYEINIEKMKGLLCFWLERAPNFSKLLLQALREKGDEPIFVDNLARELNVSATKVGQTLQKLGIVTTRKRFNKLMRRKITTSREMIEQIAQHYLAN